jgi:alpha-D-ribose 1-methylphosphonate 5-triphosphate synthase subunit PhnH
MLAALNSQESTLVFRTMLNALAFPGRRFDLPNNLVAQMPAATLPLLALVDVETTFCAPGAAQWQADIAMITSSRVVAATDARFVLFADLPSASDILHLGRGTAHRPELGCKVVLAVEHLPESRPVTNDERPTGAGHCATLRGPGVQTSIVVAIQPGVDEFLTARATAVADAPAGIDCWFVANDGGVMGLPRTTHATFDGAGN